MRREFIKHFIDYFLDKKSPLQIYAKKANQIGSSYASPNFSMLLKTVSYLISMCLQPVNQCLQPVNQCFQPVSKFSLSQDDLLLLLHFDSL